MKPYQNSAAPNVTTPVNGPPTYAPYSGDVEAGDRGEIGYDDRQMPEMVNGKRRYTFTKMHADYYDSSYVGGDHLMWLENAIVSVDSFFTTLFRAFFGLIRILLTPFFALWIEGINFMGWATSKTSIEVIPVLLDQLFKPLVWIMSEFMFKPIATAFAAAFAWILEFHALHKILYAIVDAIVRIVKACKIVNITYNNGAAATLPRHVHESDYSSDNN